MRHRLFTGALALVLWTPATAAADDAREIAKTLAAFTNAVKEEVLRFVASREGLANARERNIDVLETNAIDLQTGNETDVAIWSVAEDEIRVNLFNVIRESSDATAANQEILLTRRSRIQENVAAARTSANTRAKKLADAAKALGQLSVKPDIKATLEFYGTFFEEVKESIDEATENAETSAAAGEAAVTGKAEERSGG